MERVKHTLIVLQNFMFAESINLDLDIKTISSKITTMYSDAVSMKVKLKITGRLLNQDGRSLGAAARGGLRPPRVWARREGCILVFTGTVWLASEAGSCHRRALRTVGPSLVRHSC